MKYLAIPIIILGINLVYYPVFAQDNIYPTRTIDQGVPEPNQALQNERTGKTIPEEIKTNTNSESCAEKLDKGILDNKCKPNKTGKKKILKKQKDHIPPPEEIGD